VRIDNKTVIIQPLSRRDRILVADESISMTDQPTNSNLKWILIVFISILFVGAVCFVMFATYPANEYRVAKELEARGYVIIYDRQDDTFFWQRPFYVTRSNHPSITRNDCRLICQLPRLDTCGIMYGDMSDLCLDDIGNCQELSDVQFIQVSRFPVSELQKLTACPITTLWVESTDVPLNDSNLDVFASFTELETLILQFNNTGVTDACLEYFEKIPTLRQLILPGSSITKEGVEEFQKKRPGVKIVFE
jgi:hypothetical protein